jgi:uncharacterized MAPEG superfamily protein
MAIVVVAVLLALVVLGGLACVVSAESQTEEGGSLEPNAWTLRASVGGLRRAAASARTREVSPIPGMRSGRRAAPPG